jgi:hypothetical protein
MNINDLAEMIFKNPTLEFVPLVVVRCGRFGSHQVMWLENFNKFGL